MRVRAAHVAPALLAVGVALSCVQLGAVQADVFYSGDGGLKFLLTRQFAAGDWHPDLRLEAAPWVRSLWESGLYPFGPPFAYAAGDRWMVQYPLAFMALSAPLYGTFGYAGLYVLPTLSLWALWASFLALARHLSLSPSSSSIGLGGLIFASFSTPYGAMVWEHTLAVALSFGGLCVLLPGALEAASGSSTHGISRPTGRYLCGGALLGLAVWIRPESACFAAGVLACLVAVGIAPCRALAVGSALAGLVLGLLAFNFAVYDSPLGAHAIQEVDPSTRHVPHQSAIQVAAGLGRRFLAATPVLVIAVAFALFGIFQRQQAARARLEAGLWIVASVFALGTCLLVPNCGGKQFGARYLLHALPLLWLVVALQWQRAAGLSTAWSRALRVAFVLAVLLGAQRNSYHGTRSLYRDYEQRIAPALAALRSTDSDVVVVEHQWMAQELAAALAERTFFRVRSTVDLDALARALAARGTRHFTLVGYEPRVAGSRSGPGFALRIAPRGRFGTLYLFDCVAAVRGRSSRRRRSPMHGSASRRRADDRAARWHRSAAPHSPPRAADGSV